MSAEDARIPSLADVERARELAGLLDRIQSDPDSKLDRVLEELAGMRSAMIKITVRSARGSVSTDEEHEVPAVPRIGDLIRTQYLAAARVTDVTWDLENGKVTVLVR